MTVMSPVRATRRSSETAALISWSRVTMIDPPKIWVLLKYSPGEICEPMNPR